MYQLIYASKYHNLSKGEVITNIVDKAKLNNLRDQLTGILVFSSGYFLQCLEGERGAVNKTFSKIVRDERHFNLNILTYTEIYERSFPFWTMAFASESDIKKSLYFKYGMNEFDPFKLPARGVLPFLRELGIVYLEGTGIPDVFPSLQAEGNIGESFSENL